MEKLSHHTSLEPAVKFLDYVSSPIGQLEIEASSSGISRIVFTDTPDKPVKANAIIKQCKAELKEYFAGQRYRFDVPWDQRGTAFQRAVWQCLMDIPYGGIVSYRDIAQEIDNPKAVRAVGAANGKNPISVIVPCHRVIGSNGSLTGYAWGLERKTWLLKHEQTHIKNK